MSDNQPIEIMFDLETLSLQPNALVLTIGMVVFEGGNILSNHYFRLNQRDMSKIDFHVCNDTLEWWRKQSPEARKNAMDYDNEEPKPKHPYAVLQAINWIIKRCSNMETNTTSNTSPNILIWTNGYVDLMWLNNLYQYFDVHKPWKYWQERDFRTAKAMLPDVEIPNEPIAHHAMYDAMWQTKYLIKARGN